MLDCNCHNATQPQPHTHKHPQWNAWAYFTRRMSPLCATCTLMEETETCRISVGGPALVWRKGNRKGIAEVGAGAADSTQLTYSSDILVPLPLLCAHFGERSQVLPTYRSHDYTRTWSTGFQCKALLPLVLWQGLFGIDGPGQQRNCKEFVWMAGWPGGVMISKALLPNFFKPVLTNFEVSEFFLFFNKNIIWKVWKK